MREVSEREQAAIIQKQIAAAAASGRLANLDKRVLLEMAAYQRVNEKRPASPSPAKHDPAWYDRRGAAIRERADNPAFESLCGVIRPRAQRPCRNRPAKRPDGTTSGRCKFHGGLSTGPVTKAGKRRIAQAQLLRWATYRARKAQAAI